MAEWEYVRDKKCKSIFFCFMKDNEMLEGIKKI